MNFDQVIEETMVLLRGLMDEDCKDRKILRIERLAVLFKLVKLNSRVFMPSVHKLLRSVIFTQTKSDLQSALWLKAEKDIKK